MQSAPFRTGFPYLLGSTDPCSTAVHMEPFSTSVFKVLIWIFATTTKICASDGSSRNHFRAFYATTAALLLVKAWRPGALVLSWRPSIGTSLQRHPFFRASWFGRWVVTHSLADSDFHGHRPAVYINQHLLWYLMSDCFGHLNSAFGSSHSASSAYQKWPTGHSHSWPDPN